MLQTAYILSRQFQPRQPFSLGAKIRLLGQAIAVSLLTIALQPTLRGENATEDTKFNDPTASSFASDVAVSGSFALVGASGASDAENDVTGAVYSYQKIGGEWVFDEQFFAPDGEDSDLFGSSVAMFGDVAIIGAPEDDDPTSGADSGSAYLFRHDGSEWIFEQKITASDASSNRRFGGTVAISGTVAVVGFRNETGSPGGEAYVFRYNGATWVEEKILTASDATAGDDFGAAVSVSDDVVVVGALAKSGGGAAYIYRNTTGSTWVEEKILTASDGVSGDGFGSAVAVSGSLAIIGATNVNGQVGAAYIYRNTGGATWDETRISRENPAGSAGSFGDSVAISGEVALVGAWAAQSNRGTGHLFRFDGSGWVESVIVPEDPSTNFGFGDSVALSEDYAMLGAVFDSGFGDNGAAFLYNLAPEITWADPVAIPYGTALSGTQLNATANVPGTFSYDPAAGTVLAAGSHTLNANFTPTDTTRYAGASATVSLTVDRAPLTITANDQQREAGLPNPTLTASYVGFVNGDTEASLDTPVSLSTTATTLSEPGSYPITAGGAADANYAITFAPGTLTIIGVDDFLPGDNATMFGNALVGIPALGEIETVDDEDWFAVSLEAGREYIVQVIATVTTDGRIIDPALAGIYDSSETFLGYGNDDWSDVVQNSESLFIPSQTGTYYVAAMGPPEGKDLGSLSDTGAYSVEVYDQGPVDIAALTQSFMSTNTVNEDEDLTLLVDTIVPSEVMLPTGTTGPLNEYIAAREITVDLTGSVAAEGSDFTFLYEFGATQTLQLDALDDELVEDDESVTAHVVGYIDWIIPTEFGGTEIDNLAGSPVMGNIERRYIDLMVDVTINSAPEGTTDPILDFTFVDPEIVTNVLTNFEDGSGELFNVIPLSFSGVVEGEVLANGDLLINASTGVPGQSVIVAFTVEDTRGAITQGEQEIIFGALGDDYLPGDTAIVFGSIDVDSSAVGSVEQSEDRDRFIIELEAGIVYQIDLTSATTVSGILANPEIFGVFDSLNNLLPDSSDVNSGTGNDALVTFIVDTDGFYEIEVGSFAPLEFGGYELSVTSIGVVDDFLPGIFAEVFGTAQIDLPTTGTVEVYGDRDRFEVTLQAGVQYNISLEGIETGAGSLVDPEIIGVFNNLGALVSGGADNNSGVGTNAFVDSLVVDADGIYQIEVGSDADDGIGDYTLTAEFVGYIDDFLPGDNAEVFGTAQIDVPTTGTIEIEGDRDRFEVTLQADVRYDISLEGADTGGGSLINPEIIGVYDSLGQLVPGGSDSNSGVDNNALVDSLIVDTDGIYQIEVASAGDSGIGTYTVAVDDIGVRDDHSADVGTTGSIAVGGNVVGRIDFAQDEDWFAVNLSANRIYQISLVSAAGADALADPFFRGVYDSSGVLIQNTENDDGGDDSGSSALQFATDDAGTFYLAAGGFQDLTGQYRLELNDLGLLDDDRFDITIKFTSEDVPDRYIAAFEDAVERWEEVIVGDLPSAFVDGYGIVDDILIEVAVEDIDLVFEGVEQELLAISTVLDQRSGAGALPTYSRIVINQEAVRELLNLDEFVQNTIGRALGFGSLWEEFGLVVDNINGVATYTGSNALREMSELWGTPNGVVMLEEGSDGALAAEYWSEELFGNELMTPVIARRLFSPNTSGNPDNPISALTIAAMQDLGYQVDYDAADGYRLPGTGKWIEGGSGPQLRFDFFSANQSNTIGDITSGEGREELREIVINTFIGDTITFTGEALVANDDDDEVVTVTLSVDGQPLVVAIPLGAGVDTTSPISIAAAVAVALAADPALQAIASSGVVSVAGEGSNTVGIEAVVFATGVNDGGATATLAAGSGESADLNVGTIFFEDDGSSGDGGEATLDLIGVNDVTVKSLDTTDAEITSLTVDLTDHVGTLTATGGSPAFDGGDSTVLLEVVNDNDEAGSGGVDLEDGVAQYGSVITFDDPDTSGEGENEFGIEYHFGYGETFPFAGVSSMVLEHIDATVHDGVVSFGVISEINSEEFDLDAGETGQVFGCIGTALDDGVEETPALSATGIWTFDGRPGGYAPAGGLNNLDLEIKNIDIEPGGNLVFTNTDICMTGDIDLSEAVLEIDVGSTIKVGTGGKLTLTVEQVNELRGVLQGVPIYIVGSATVFEGHPLDDPNQNGIPTLLEYALFIDPLTSNIQQALPEVTMVLTGGVQYPAIKFRRLSGSSHGLIYSIWESSNLADWTQLDMVTQLAGIEDHNDGSETVTFRGTAPIAGNGSIDQTFLQVRVKFAAP